jgi:glutamine synthetase
MLAGLQAGQLPPPPAEGNAYRGAAQSAERLPVHWPVALERFTNSSFAADLFGPDFRHLYATVRQSELDEFVSHVTPVECSLYLSPL